MVLPIYFSIFLQIICAVHAIKTMRYQWLWIILIFSFVGCAIYFIVEVLPDLRTVSDHVALGAKSIVVPDHKIKKMLMELEETDTVKNRLELAHAYMERKQFKEAIQVLDVCRTGTHKDDPEVLGQIAYANFSVGDYVKTKEALLAMPKAPQKFDNQECHLLYTMTLQKLGEKNEALADYERLIPSYIGEQARCRYALFLKESGKGEEARKIFEQIVKKCNLSPAFYRRDNKIWFETSKNELKTGTQRV
jgi:hypothetical protein